MVGAMALAVCALFDGRGERDLRGLWDRLEAQGIGSMASHTHRRHQPHLSYAVLRSWDLARVQASVDRLGDSGPFTVRFQALGTTRRGRIWLVPGVDADLARRQQAVENALRETGADLHEHYLTGRWLPHCSLAPRARIDQLPVLAQTVYDVLPLSATVARAALIDSGTGQSWRLPGIP